MNQISAWINLIQFIANDEFAQMLIWLSHCTHANWYPLRAEKHDEVLKSLKWALINYRTRCWPQIGKSIHFARDYLELPAVPRKKASCGTSLALQRKILLMEVQQRHNADLRSFFKAVGRIKYCWILILRFELATSIYLIKWKSGRVTSKASKAFLIKKSESLVALKIHKIKFY